MGPHKKHRKRSSSSSSHQKAKKTKIDKKKKSEKYSSSSESSTDSSSSSSTSLSSSTESSEEERRTKLDKSKKKLIKTKKQPRAEQIQKKTKSGQKNDETPPELLEKSKAMAPMTKEEWEKRQSKIRRVYDETTGRYRLIKGDGEIIEEIVSRDRHKAINQQATQGDGSYFQSQMMNHLKK